MHLVKLATLLLLTIYNGEKASAFSSLPNHPSQTGELTMPPADRIREQNEKDPGRLAHTRLFSTGEINS